MRASALASEFLMGANIQQRRQTKQGVSNAAPQRCRVFAKDTRKGQEKYWPKVEHWPKGELYRALCEEDGKESTFAWGVPNGWRLAPDFRLPPAIEPGTRDALVGRVLRKDWGKSGLYLGFVKSWAAGEGEGDDAEDWYSVHYVDGEVHDETLADLLPLLIPDDAWHVTLSDPEFAAAAAAGTIGSVSLIAPGIEDALPAGHRCRLSQQSDAPSTDAPAETAMQEYAALQVLLPTLHSAFDRSRAVLLSTLAIITVLAASGASKKVLKMSFRGFTRLPLFALLLFRHDALHATLNSGKRCFNRAFTMAKALDLDDTSGGVEKCIHEKLSDVYVHSGRPTNQAGIYIVGDFVAWVVKQFRGSQFDAAVSARVWSCFAKADHLALRDAFEAIIGNAYGLHSALRWGKRQSAVRFYGEPQDDVEREDNEAKAGKLVKAMWKHLRGDLCKLFPGDCDATFNKVFASNGWMMRSFHTVGHLVTDFEKGCALPLIPPARSRTTMCPPPRASPQPFPRAPYPHPLTLKGDAEGRGADRGAAGHLATDAAPGDDGPPAQHPELGESPQTRDHPAHGAGEPTHHTTAVPARIPAMVAVGHHLLWQVREKVNGLQSFQEAQRAKRSGPQGLGRSLAAWLSCLHQSSDRAIAGDGYSGMAAPVHLRAEWTAGPSGNFPVGEWQCREYVRARCHYWGVSPRVPPESPLTTVGLLRARSLRRGRRFTTSTLCCRPSCAAWRTTPRISLTLARTSLTRPSMASTWAATVTASRGQATSRERAASRGRAAIRGQAAASRGRAGTSRGRAASLQMGCRLTPGLRLLPARATFDAHVASCILRSVCVPRYFIFISNCC